MTEVLGLTLLDWEDEPGVSGGTGVYDPTGMKTFMAVVYNMRKGGATSPPASGKPSWTGDYAWDGRYTAKAVVDWIRAGFGLPPAGDGTNPIRRGVEMVSTRIGKGGRAKPTFHDLNGRFIRHVSESRLGAYVLRLQGNGPPAD